MPVVPNWFIEGLVLCKTVYGCVHLKYPVESIQKSSGLIVSRLWVSVCRRYVRDRDEGDVKLQSIKLMSSLL